MSSQYQKGGGFTWSGGEQPKTAWDKFQTWLVMNVGSKEAEEASLIVLRIIEEEREACAKIADAAASAATKVSAHGTIVNAPRTAMDIADFIRARSTEGKDG
jgi:hypothetical protein